MQFQQVISAVFVCLFALVAAHKGMIDDDIHRDVGLTFAQTDFQGEYKTIFEVKGESECLPLYVSPDQPTLAFVNI